jgi:LDH2 family malate/lactate/ureidoglycolate dehydrogenase
MGVNVAIDDLMGFALQGLLRCGASERHARITAELLVRTDSWGVYSHGTKLLGGYLQRLAAGGLRTDCEPEVVARGPAWALVDGHSVMGQVTSKLAMEQAIELARAAGIGYVGVRNSCHFGAAGVYVDMAAQAGLIGIAMANDIPSVAAPGARRAVVGTNPLAYAVPTGRAHPILLDISMATVAGGKVYAACQRGEVIPDNWLIDSEGRPTSDGSLYPDHASLAPMTGHKGYGIALLIETLSGLLTGASVTWSVGSWMHGDLSRPTDHGAAFLAIDPAQVIGSGFEERVDALVDEIHQTPTAEGVDQVYLPGEMEWMRREAAIKLGIPLPSDVRHSLRGVADRWELPRFPGLDD